jgi:DNA-binding NtrC family response regulator
LKLREFKARVICAGNQNLDALVENGRFRPDLFHRLKVGHIRIPPLRERRDDIPPLVQLFIARESTNKKRNIAGISPEAMAMLQERTWPGNIRELENAIQRAVLMCDRDKLEARHFDFLQDAARSKPGAGHAEVFDAERVVLPDRSLDLSVLTNTIIRRALEKFGGNKTKASEYLGISRYALHRKLRDMA